MLSETNTNPPRCIALATFVPKVRLPRGLEVVRHELKNTLEPVALDILVSSVMDGNSVLM